MLPTGVELGFIIGCALPIAEKAGEAMGKKYDNKRKANADSRAFTNLNVQNFEYLKFVPLSMAEICKCVHIPPCPIAKAMKE